MELRASLSLVGGLLLTSALTQVAPAIEWQKCLGGSGDDQANCIQQTTDSGYILAGWAQSIDGDISGNHGLADCWVVKLNAAGTVVWQRALGGSASDAGRSIQQTIDGGYVVAGHTISNDGDVSGNHGSSDCWVVKLDGLGTIVWQKALGGGASDYATSIQQTSDGGYVLAGLTASDEGDVSGNHGSADFWVVRLDAAGALVWQNTLGGSAFDWAGSIRQTSDGGYIVAGHTESNDGDVTGNHGYADFWVVKLDTAGTLVWQKALGGSGNDEAGSIWQTSDGGYIVTGQTYSNDGDVSGNQGGRDCWVVKLDASGTLVWQRTLGGSSDDYSISIQQISGGGYIVAGATTSNDGDVSGNHGLRDFWIVNLDSVGSIVWQKAMGGSVDDGASIINQTGDEGYIVAGSAASPDGDVIGNHGVVDYWVVKLVGSGTGLEETNASAFTISPNPGNGLVQVRSPSEMKNALLTLTDAMGREVLQDQMNGSEHTLDLRSLRAGLYVLSLRSEKSISTQRLVIE